MSTSITTPASSRQPLGPIDVGATPPVSFLTLVKVELRKSADTRAGFWLLLLTAVFTVTAMVTFTLEPHRSRVIAAKAVAGLALAAAVVAIALVAAVLANLLYAGIEGVDPSWELSSGQLGGFLLSQAFAMLTGFALATLLLNTPAAIVTYFAYIFILPAIFAVAAVFLDWFADLQPWIDFNFAQVPLIEGSMVGEDWAHLLVAGLVWLVLPVTFGVWRVLRAEVK